MSDVLAVHITLWIMHVRHCENEVLQLRWYRIIVIKITIPALFLIILYDVCKTSIIL